MPLTSADFLNQAQLLLQSRDKTFGIVPVSEKIDKNLFTVQETNVYCDLDINFFARMDKIKQRMNICDPKVKSYVEKTLSEMQAQISDMQAAAKEYRLLSFAKSLAEQVGADDPGAAQAVQELQEKMKMYRPNLLNREDYPSKKEWQAAEKEAEEKLPKDVRNQRKSIKELTAVLSGLEYVAFVNKPGVDDGYYYGKHNPDGTLTVEELGDRTPKEMKARGYSTDFAGNLDTKVGKVLKSMGKLPPKDIVALASKMHLPQTAEVQFNSFTKNYIKYELNDPKNLTQNGEALLGMISNDIQEEKEAYLEFGDKNFDKYVTDSVFGSVEMFLYALPSAGQQQRVLIGGRPFADIFEEGTGSLENQFAVQNRRREREIKRLEALPQSEERDEKLASAKARTSGITSTDGKIAMATAIAAALKNGVPVTILAVDAQQIEMPPVTLTAKGLDKPIPKPEIGRWKSFANKWLGWYKEDFAQLDKYNAQQKMKDDEKIARGKFYAENLTGLIDGAKQLKDRSPEMEKFEDMFLSVQERSRNLNLAREWQIQERIAQYQYTDSEYKGLADLADKYFETRQKLLQPAAEKKSSAMKL